MKKIKNIVLLLVGALTVLSCSTDDKSVDILFDTVANGAVLRTLNFNNTYNVFDVNDDTFKFELQLEEQDAQNGGLLSEVRLFQAFNDNTDDATDNSKAEALIRTFAASDFTTGPEGFPVLDFSMQLADALTGNGLTIDDVFGGDVFAYRLELELTDGRVFTNTAAGTVLSGSFFSSPFAYNVTVKCVPVTPFAGDYKLNLKDSFGDGWDGAFITVTIDGTATDYTFTSGGSASFEFTVPDGTTTLEFSYTAGSFEEEHSYEIVGPFGEVAAADGPGPAPGAIILNICN